MKKVIFALMAGLVFVACQNASNSTSDNSGAQNTVVISPETVKASQVKAQTILDKFNEISKTVEVAKATATPEQQAQLDQVAQQLGDILKKQEILTRGLEMAADPGAAGAPTQTVLEDYVKSAENYKDMIQDFEKRIEEIKSGQTKQN